MNGEIGNGKMPGDGDDVAEPTAETEDLTLSDDIDADNVGDISVEINVEELVANFDADVKDAPAHRKEVRRRLDEIEEERRISRELDSTFNFNLEDDF